MLGDPSIVPDLFKIETWSFSGVASIVGTRVKVVSDGVFDSIVAEFS